jgi:hypothetical protein
MSEVLDHRTLYRLPWTLPDNAIAWLEPTAKCNLHCEGCYRANVNQHKSLEEVAEELDVFERYRNVDGVSIAGGDPLTHPRVVDIVRMVAERGRKPILNTNGLALTEDLLKDLKRAGLEGLTFHIDSKQGRPKWKNKTEQETNASTTPRWLLEWAVWVAPSTPLCMTTRSMRCPISWPGRRNTSTSST